MMEARDSSHQIELHMQAFYEHIRAGAGAFPLNQPSPLQQQQQQQQQQQHASPHHPHHHYHQQQQQQQHQQPAHHHLHHLHHLHHYQQQQQQQQEQQLQENASRNSFNPSIIHSPAPLRQMSPNPNFNPGPGPGPNHNPGPNPGSNINPSSSSGMSVCYPPETPPHVMPHQVQTGSPPSGIGLSTSPGSAMLPRPASVFKKKRGRPRKYTTDVNGSAASVIPLNSVPAGDKKGGGRGPSKKTQSSTSGGVTGQGFTPHVLTVGAGEDVTAKIMTFSQHGPWAVCILSANGAISNASLLHAGISSGTVTYEGRFEILSLSGLFLLTEDGATRSRSGGFSVSLAGQDGRVIGGRVAGLLIAATPIQVVVGTFFPESRKTQAKAGNLEGSSSLPPTGGTREPSMQMMDKVHVDAIEPVNDYVPDPPEGLLKEEHCASNAMADWRASEYNDKPR